MEAALPSPNPIAHLEEVWKIYRLGTIDVPAVRGVSLKVNEGDYLVIVGPSGSGKSTLMHLLGCLDTPTSGNYWLRGERVADLNDSELAEIRNRRIGFVFQQFNLLAPISALRNVELPLVYAGVPRPERKERAEAMLARLGLEKWAQHKPAELSGGQQQRVAIARALVTNPDFVLADEPTGNLDSVASSEVMDLFDELSRDGKTIVLITHEMDIARRAHLIVRVRDGLLVDAS